LIPMAEAHCYHFMLQEFNKTVEKSSSNPRLTHVLKLGRFVWANS